MTCSICDQKSDAVFCDDCKSALKKLLQKHSVTATGKHDWRPLQIKQSRLKASVSVNQSVPKAK